MSAAREHHPVAQGRIAVPPARLGEELEHIRREAAKLDAEQELKETGRSTPRLRTTLANLIIFVSRHGWSVTDGAIDKLITELCISHPSRFFVVTYACDGAAAQCLCEGKVTTAVSSRCVLADSGAHICSEEVYINVRPKSLPVVSNLLLSLLVPNVNTVLIMLCDPARKLLGCWHENAEQRYITLVRSIAKECSLLVYDSLLFDNYGESLAALLQENGTSVLPGRECAHYDLNWGRIEKWRALVTEQFDAERMSSAVGNIKELRFVSSRRVGQREERHCSSEALLLAGWFMARLGWEAVDAQQQPGEAVAVSCQAPVGTRPVIRFSEEEQATRGDAAGSVSLIELVLEGEEKKERIRLEQLTGQGTIAVSLDPAATGGAHDSLVRRVPFVRQPLEKSIVSDLRSHGGNMTQIRDRDYLDAVNKAASVSTLISRCR